LVIYDAVVPPICEFALYQLDQGGSASGVAIPGPFDAALYSRYKYGSTVAAGWFARALGQAFLDRYPRLAHQPRLLIASSPYRRVPTAANALAVRFAAVLNAARAGRGLPPAPLVHIERMAASSGDYGTLSTDARTRLMAVNALSFDRLRPYADGAHLIVVDDVKVTGAHQRCLTRASETLPLGSRTFAHIAAFDGTGTERLDPALEDRLNHAVISTLDDLAGLVRGSDFTWNVRVCKFLLCPASRSDLPSFLVRMTDRFVRELRYNSFSDGYARMDAYCESHAIVQRELHRRGRLRAGLRRPASPAMASLAN
jgi:phosphoribosyl transferase-like protein